MYFILSKGDLNTKKNQKKAIFPVWTSRITSFSQFYSEKSRCFNDFLKILVTSSECAKTSLRGSSLKFRIEKFEIKTESVKTSKSVSGTNSDDLPEKSETSVFVDGVRDILVLGHIFYVNPKATSAPAHSLS